MKLLIVILAIIAVVSADRIELRDVLGRSISSSAIDAIEKMRDQMPCGFPKYGIPPLAPLKIEHKELALKTNSLSVDGVVEGVRIDGLNNFEISEFKINVIFSKVTFSFFWPSIVVRSMYDLETSAKAYGFTVDVKGKGNILMDLKELQISGTIKYSIFNGVKVKTLEIVPSIGDVDSNIDGILGQGLGNKKMNEFLEELILLGCNDNQELITKTIEDMLVPKINEACEGYTLTDIIGIIAGGEGGETEKCIPPPED
ncbi:uncharacterized protein LOC129913621 isoform X2 [Episyrphus balteatus]|uniref:uncharacterized protein LOC129913621 isoform X2 n=1 Tax=Episyrphus balteatus TaxID=286459 RepID=UPI002486A26A|nr:uncharacterized protein LOC129913621 isoform X2 [Episyrphus balteatus]